MPGVNENDLQTIIDEYKNHNLPEIDALTPEFDRLRELQNKVTANAGDFSVSEAVKEACEKQFFDVLKNIMDKLEQIKHLPQALVKNTKTLQILLLRQLSITALNNLSDLLNDLTTISAKSAEMKEIGDFINSCTKYGLNAEIMQALTERGFENLKLMYKMLTSIGTINDSYSVATAKIDKVDLSKSPVVDLEVTQLMMKLAQVRQAFYDKLPADDQAALNIMTKAFIKDCTDAINASKQVLENERGWGEFLTDLLESLVKAVVTLVTLGFGNTNFSFYSNPNKDTRTTLDEVQAELAQTKLG